MLKTFARTLLVAALLAGCANSQKDDRTVERDLNSGGSRYTSAQVSGAKSRINLDAVKQAFWATQGNDLDTAMKGFEQRVNEIYQGDEVVSIDASKQGTGVMVVGFIDKNQQPGFQQGDDRLFTIEQTGQAANDQVPYRMSYGDGRPYYEGVEHYHHDNGGFWTGFLLGHIVGGWGHYGGHYYTPFTRYHTITEYRTAYRNTPAYRTQVASNRAFTTRFNNTAPGGGAASTRRFGSGGFSSGSGGTTSTRKWGGGPGSSGGSSASTGSSGSSMSTWSGRRPSSSSTGTTSTSTRSWGSRSSSSSSSSGWSGRRSSSTSSSRRRR